jgi:hypothetical protein
MKFIDQNERPIADVSALPNVEPTVATGTTPDLPPILGTTEADEPAGGAEGEDDPKLSRRDYLIARLKHMQERTAAYAQQTLGQQPHLPLMAVVASLDVAIGFANELPANWKPVRPAAPSTDLAPGARVIIRERYRATYQDDLSESDMNGLVVERVGEKRLRCKTPGGALVLIPAGHVIVLR